MNTIDHKTGNHSSGRLVVLCACACFLFYCGRETVHGAYFFEMTPEYSEAALEAIVPEVAEFLGKLDLPPGRQLTRESVEEFKCLNRVGDVGGLLLLTNRAFLIFERGHVSHYSTTNSYFTLQDPKEVPRFYGKLKLTREEAIARARDCIQRLGYSLEAVFAELEPEVQMPFRPPREPEKVVPHYLITWKGPAGGGATASIEIDGSNGQVTRLYFLCKNLWSEPPKIDVAEKRLPKGHPLRSDPPQVNPAYAAQLRPLALEAANEFLKKARLQPSSVSSNQVERFDHAIEPTGVDTRIVLTDGTTFVFKLNRITQYTNPRAFFTFEGKYVVSDFQGSWNLSEENAVQRARDMFRRLEDSDLKITLGLEAMPESIYRPRSPGFDPPLIPRMQMNWRQRDAQDRMFSEASAEIDMETGEITHVSWWHRNMFGDAPKIAIPIRSPGTSTSESE